MKESELKPCPFCGGKAEYDEIHTDNGGAEVYYREYHVYTVMCSCCRAAISSYLDEEDVKRSWNRRV